MRALVVEDDPGIASGLSDSLSQAGYAVDVCPTLDAAWAALAVEPFDVLLLDLGLPARLRRLGERSRAHEALPRSDMPVLIMTARDGVSDRISGLDSGADDYIVKPFDANELLARLRAMLRRASGRSNPVIEHGDLVLDPATRTVERAGLPVALGGRELAVVCMVVFVKLRQPAAQLH